MTDKISVRVWGDWACFTRPEMKVERVSYPLMTPSAARGILEAIFWEPQMYYLIDAVRVVRRGAWISFKRNEVTARISLTNARSWMEGRKQVTPIIAGGGATDFTQRNTLALQGVEYIITAEVRLTELGKKTGQKVQKYRDEVTRRAKSGKCFHRPCLGMREFAADFDWEEDASTALQRRAAEMSDGWQAWGKDDLGLMLYDLFDQEDRAKGFRWLSATEKTAYKFERETRAAQLSKGEAKKLLKEALPEEEGTFIKPLAAFFHARVRDSVMECHPSRITLIRQNGGTH
ncbi:MAG TPA: type I-C CRISPR-associated protein Cas5c [Blastocatellia bacterium]|nr:type I-C CRISPR-associated protein Cas5c [Blastocatellia bacterium]